MFVVVVDENIVGGDDVVNDNGENDNGANDDDDNDDNGNGDVNDNDDFHDNIGDDDLVNRSEEWEKITESDRKKIGLVMDDDGEFW